MPNRPHGPPAPPDIKPTIDRYYDECMASSTSKKKDNPREYCARVAWQRFCQHNTPDHPSCTKYGKTKATKGSKAEGVLMPEKRPFGALFALVEGHPHNDGAVEREEFNTLDPSDPLDAEARQAMTDFVLERLPPSRKFVTAKNEEGFVFYDSRGRVAQVTIDEIDDGELRRLAERLGFNNEMEPPLPETPPDYVEPTADNTSGVRGIPPDREDGRAGGIRADIVAIVRG